MGGRISRCVVTRSEYGVDVEAGRGGTVENCDLRGNRIGSRLWGGSVIHRNNQEDGRIASAWRFLRHGEEIVNKPVVADAKSSGPILHIVIPGEGPFSPTPETI